MGPLQGIKRRASSLTVLTTDLSTFYSDNDADGDDEAEGDLSLESGYVASSKGDNTTPSEGSRHPSFKRKSHVRIIDNRSGAAGVRVARQRSAYTTEDDDDLSLDAGDEAVLVSAGPSILIINPSTSSTSNGKHVTLLTGSSAEPSPSVPSSEHAASFVYQSPDVLSEAEVTSIRQRPSTERRHSSFIPTSGSPVGTRGALKRFNTTTAIYRTSKASSEMRKASIKSNYHRAHPHRRRTSPYSDYSPARSLRGSCSGSGGIHNHRASLPVCSSCSGGPGSSSHQPRLSSPHPSSSRHSQIANQSSQSSDEVDACCSYTRFYTPMEPICVVNLANPGR